MIAGYKAFMTYMLSGNTGSTNIYGYSSAIHCNYIHTLIFETLSNKEFNIYFENPEEFKFLSVSGGTGFTANKLIVLAQRIPFEDGENVDAIRPDPTAWKLFDVTEQVSGYTSGQTLSAEDLTWGVFRIPMSKYNLAPYYNLDYILQLCWMLSL